MAAKVVLASRQFPKDYQEFMGKYPGLEATFREFLAFRETARPDQGFNLKDARISNNKFWRCHLVHGKAILVYQLVGAEIRLIAIDDHNVLEVGSTVMRYAKSLKAEDYYQFNVDAPIVPKPVALPAPRPKPQPEAIPMDQETDTTEAPVEPNDPAEVPNPLLESKLVHYLRDRQLLYVPRPANPVIVLFLDREIIAPKGDALVIDTVTHAVHHLTVNELDAHFKPGAEPATSLGAAVVASLDIPPANPDPAELTVPDAPPMMRTTVRRHNVGPQLGRLIVTMAYLQGHLSTTKFDTPTITQYMAARDRKSMSALMVSAQNAGLIRKAGNRPGRPGYYYTLTATGERTSKSLGDWPFTVSRMTAPFQTAAAK